ncbi:DUF6163 family protein [Aureimonas sp. Leaf324]|jgi:hypothetical protein|uniref:DUF6163 family protein n=1 Tax=Aureimonas sp. Leaf324 TaxID=1736336 RepID=UPI0006F31554|nr:DUF6163 family protein [Aureimonas sp. Leaf324]KQQ91541.1 hypothetical protein ASF65_01955 [Aureimonas sp. Leaf324]
MTLEIFDRDRDETINRTLIVWLCRIAGLAMFGMGLVYWIRLIGVFDGPLWRFDLMPVWWRIACPSLAVLYPVAGTGLWLAASWGGVIWILVAACEGVMRLGFPHLFGTDPLLLGGHAFGLALLAALRIVGAVERHRRLRGDR